MSANQTFRETLAFLIVRDNAHQNAFAKAIETLGVELAKLSPVPNYDINSAESMLNYHDAQFTFRFDETRIGEIYQGRSPAEMADSYKS